MEGILNWAQIGLLVGLVVVWILRRGRLRNAAPLVWVHPVLLCMLVVDWLGRDALLDFVEAMIQQYDVRDAARAMTAVSSAVYLWLPVVLFVVAGALSRLLAPATARDDQDWIRRGAGGIRLLAVLYVAAGIYYLIA